MNRLVKFLAALFFFSLLVFLTTTGFLIKESYGLCAMHAFQSFLTMVVSGAGLFVVIRSLVNR